MANLASRSDLPDNRTVGSSLLMVLALSDNSLLATLREPQVLQCVELSLHSCKVSIMQDTTWQTAWHALNGLQQVLTQHLPVQLSLVEPYNHVHVLQAWRNIGICLSFLRGLLRYAAHHLVYAHELIFCGTEHRL
jgi:hypothetical protein